MVKMAKKGFFMVFYGPKAIFMVCGSPVICGEWRLCYDGEWGDGGRKYHHITHHAHADTHMYAHAHT